MAVESRARAGAPGRGLVPEGRAALLLDALVLVGCMIIAVRGRSRLPFLETNGGQVGSTTLLIAAAIGLVWMTLIAAHRGYSADVFGAGTDEYRRVLDASVLTAAGAGIVCYFAQYELSRGFFLIAFALSTPALLGARFAMRRLIHQSRRQGRLGRWVLLVGAESHVEEIAHVLSRETWLGYHVVGVALPESAGGTTRQTSSGMPVLGDTARVGELALGSRVDVVLVAGGAFERAEDLHTLAWDLEDQDIEVLVAPNLTDISMERVTFRPVGGMPLVRVDGPRALRASRWSKRAFDVVGSGLLLLLLGPFMLAAALRIRMYDGGPALFSHVRVGRDGSTFRCLKFRTMVVDAEARVEAMQQELGASALLFKVKDDPRITRPGRWLRRYSIDELPQLVNVVRGDMSLVGPRPQVEREVAVYERRMHRRLRVRPGMTGLWQVSGRNELSASEAMRLDLYYVDNWSMLQDVSILARTVHAVVSGRGAY